MKCLSSTDYIIIILAVAYEVSFSAFGSFSVVGNWHIPYRDDSSASDSRYLHCGGIVQAAVTHTGLTINMYVLSLQWRPPENYHGMVTIIASVVRDYKTYWTGIQSTPVHVVRNNVSDESHNHNISDDSHKASEDSHKVMDDSQNISDDSDKATEDSHKVNDGRKYLDSDDHQFLDRDSHNVSDKHDHSHQYVDSDVLFGGGSQLTYHKNPLEDLPTTASTSISLGNSEANEEYLTSKALTYFERKREDDSLPYKENTFDAVKIDEVDLNLNTTESSRKARINSDDSYKRLESQYGAWQENSSDIGRSRLGCFLIVIVIISSFY